MIRYQVFKHRDLWCLETLKHGTVGFKTWREAMDMLEIVAKAEQHWPALEQDSLGSFRFNSR